MRQCWLLIGLLLVSSCSQDGTALEQYGRVIDKAGLLDPEAESRIARKLELAEQRYGPQMVIVTMPSLGGRKIKDVSLELARKWGIGDARRNDGLLLLIANKQRELRIEVGYGLEGTFNDHFAKKVIDETITPAFRKNDFERGIEAGVERMIAKMKAAPTLPANDNRSPINLDKVA